MVLLPYTKLELSLYWSKFFTVTKIELKLPLNNKKVGIDRLM